MRYFTSIACAALCLASAPALASLSQDGRKGSTVIALPERLADIQSAASIAEGVAARSMVISDLGDLVLPTPFSGYAPQPLGFAAPANGVKPVIMVSEQSALRYAAIGAVLLPIILGGGSGAGFSGPATSPGGGTPVPPPPPSGPGGGGEVPVPVIPEPATWLMLLLGFAAVGTGARRSIAARTLEPG